MWNESVGAGGAVFIGGAHERVQTGPDHVRLGPERERVQTGLDHVRLGLGPDRDLHEVRGCANIEEIVAFKRNSAFSSSPLKENTIIIRDARTETVFKNGCQNYQNLI